MSAEPSDLHYRSLTETAERIRRRELSPVAVTEAMLERIGRLDGGLHSYRTVTADLARAQAAQAESEIAAGRYRGPLHGIPVAVKDLCFTEGIPTSAGMPIHRGFRPDHDATVVRRLADAGAVLLGKQHLTEGACIEHHPEFGLPVNPWRADLWTGASSSGSGVATAAGLCFASVGSDTGGSIRFPSAPNGVTGVKPTWGRISRHGIFNLAESYDTLGPMARSAADAAAMLGVLAGDDPADPTSLPAAVPDYLGGLAGVEGARGLRIGIDRAYNDAGADPETTGLLEAAAAVLRDLGAELRPVAFPDHQPLCAHLAEVHMAELASAHAATYPEQKQRYGRWLTAGLESGLAMSPVDYARTTIERDRFKGRLVRLFAEVDAVLMPVFSFATPTWQEVEAIVETEISRLFRFTFPINASGSPSVTFPCGFTGDGRPIGIQLVGAHLSEAVLLRAVHAYQQATDWHLRRPPLP